MTETTVEDVMTETTAEDNVVELIAYTTPNPKDVVNPKPTLLDNQNAEPTYLQKEKILADL